MVEKVASMLQKVEKQSAIKSGRSLQTKSSNNFYGMMEHRVQNPLQTYFGRRYNLQLKKATNGKAYPIVTCKRGGLDGSPFTMQLPVPTPVRAYPLCCKPPAVPENVQDFFS